MRKLHGVYEQGNYDTQATTGMMERKSEPSLKPPKKWFKQKEKEIKKSNPSYTPAQIAATVGKIWYSNMDDAQKKAAREAEGKTYGSANEAMKHDVRTWETRKEAQEYADKFVPPPAKAEVVPYKGKFAIKMLRSIFDKEKMFFKDAVEVNEVNGKWMITDWASNDVFNGKTFNSFDDADEFLTAFIEKKYPETKDNEDKFAEERGEYEIVYANRTRETNYLDPKDPRNGKKLVGEANAKGAANAQIAMLKLQLKNKKLDPKKKEKLEKAIEVLKKKKGIVKESEDNESEELKAMKVARQHIIQLADMVNTYSEKLKLGKKVHVEDFTEVLDKMITKHKGKMKESEDDEPTEPDEEDIVFSSTGPLGAQTSVDVVGGRHLGTFSEYEEAAQCAKDYMKKTNMYPNVWQLSDHGNYHLTTLDEAQGLKKNEQGVVVYDNGGKTADRYSVYISHKGPRGYSGWDLYTMSENPSHPQGVNQYSHTVTAFNPEKDEVRMAIGKLPKEVQMAIKKRQTDESVVESRQISETVEDLRNAAKKLEAIYIKYKTPAEVNTGVKEATDPTFVVIKEHGKITGRMDSKQFMKSVEAPKNASLQDCIKAFNEKKKSEGVVASIGIKGKDKTLEDEVPLIPEAAGNIDEAAIIEDLVEKFGEDKREEIKDSLKFPGGRYESWSDEGGSFEADGEEYNFFLSEDVAEKVAFDVVKNDLEDEPELFSKDFIKQHISITPTDMRIIAGEEAEALADGEEFEDEKAKEEWIAQKHEEIEEQLKDPIQYFVNDMGAYTEDELLKASFITIDVDEAAKEAVSIDGWAHFLSTYNSDYATTRGGIVYFRE